MLGGSSSPGCMSLGQAVGARCPRAAGAGVRGWGPRSVPLACVPSGVSRAAGIGACCSGGGPLTVVRGVWCQANSLPLLLPVLGRAAGPRCPFPLGAGGAGVGTQQWPNVARSSKPALRALGVVGGSLGSGTLPPPAACPGGKQPGSAAHLLCAAVPGTGPLACAPCRVPHAAGGAGGFPGGGDLSAL